MNVKVWSLISPQKSCLLIPKLLLVALTSILSGWNTTIFLPLHDVYTFNVMHSVQKQTQAYAVYWSLPRTHNVEKISSSINDARKAEYPLAKKWNWAPTLSTQLKMRTEDLNIRPETVKLEKEKKKKKKKHSKDAPGLTMISWLWHPKHRQQKQKQISRFTLS